MELRVVCVVFGGDGDPDEVKRSITKKLPGSLVQTVDSQAAANGAYVEMIAAQTLHAEGTGSQLAKKLEVDFLLRLARTTQISRAIEQVGAKKGRPFLLVIAGPERQLAEVEPDVYGHGFGFGGGKKLGKRQLSSDELDKIESAALLNVEKA